MPENYVIAFSTDPSSGPRDIQGGGTGFQFRHGDSWIPSSTSLDHVPSFQLDSEEGLKALCDYIHGSLDALPNEESYTLDIHWEVHHDKTKGIPLSLFGALKRASDWHGGLLHVSGGELQDPLEEYLSPLTTKELSPVLWRGSLAFFVGLEDYNRPHEELPGFSLSSPIPNIIFPGTRTLSRSLLVVSTNIDISSVPKAYIRDPISLHFECQRNKTLFSVFRSTYLSSQRMGLILRLETSSNAKDFGSELKTSAWSRCFLSENPDPSEHLKPSLGKQPESIFILIFGGSSSSCESVFSGWTLSSEGCHPFEGFGDRENVFDEMEIPLFRLPKQVDALMEILKETETKVLKTLEQVKPSLLDESSNESTRRIIRKRIAERLGLSASSEGIFRSSSNSSLEEEESGEGRGESEMERFLGFLSEQQRLREEAKDRSNCSEGYIKWEVKELLKFFTDEGLAKLKDSQTEVLLSRVKRVMPTQENVLWHRSTEKEDDVMDIVYNKGEDSEAMDRDRMEILKTHIGLHKETLCTGPSKSGGPDVIIPLRAKKTKSLPPNKSEEQRPLRTSPRKKKQQAAASSSNNASKEEVFKQKLRNAVFNALSSKGIGMKHELFRPCFKKLFEICKMYTGSKVPGGQGSTKEWLNKVALQNVDPVINLEKTLHGS